MHANPMRAHSPNANGGLGLDEADDEERVTEGELDTLLRHRGARGERVISVFDLVMGWGGAFVYLLDSAGRDFAAGASSGAFADGFNVFRVVLMTSEARIDRSFGESCAGSPLRWDGFFAPFVPTVAVLAGLVLEAVFLLATAPADGAGGSS